MIRRAEGAKKTIFFEEMYGTDITQFRSTGEVDSFIEGKLGRKLETKRSSSNLVSQSGDVFPEGRYDVDHKFRRMLGLEK